MDSIIISYCIKKVFLYIMDIPQQMNDSINQVTDKNVREALLLMAYKLVSGNSELEEKVSDLQTICNNLNERLRVQEHYTIKDSIPIKNPPFYLKKYSGDF